MSHGNLSRGLPKAVPWRRWKTRVNELMRRALKPPIIKMYTLQIAGGDFSRLNNMTHFSDKQTFVTRPWIPTLSHLPFCTCVRGQTFVLTAPTAATNELVQQQYNTQALSAQKFLRVLSLRACVHVSDDVVKELVTACPRLSILDLAHLPCLTVSTANVTSCCKYVHTGRGGIHPVPAQQPWRAKDSPRGSVPRGSVARTIEEKPLLFGVCL